MSFNGNRRKYRFLYLGGAIIALIFWGLTVFSCGDRERCAEKVNERNRGNSREFDRNEFEVKLESLPSGATMSNVIEGLYDISEWSVNIDDELYIDDDCSFDSVERAYLVPHYANVEKFIFGGYVNEVGKNIDPEVFVVQWIKVELKDYFLSYRWKEKWVLVMETNRDN